MNRIISITLLLAFCQNITWPLLSSCLRDSSSDVEQAHSEWPEPTEEKTKSEFKSEADIWSHLAAISRLSSAMSSYFAESFDTAQGQILLPYIPPEV